MQIKTGSYSLVKIFEIEVENADYKISSIILIM